MTKTIPAKPGLSLANQWIGEHWHEFRGQWIAVFRNKLIATAPTYIELQEALRGCELYDWVLVAHIPYKIDDKRG